MSASGEDRRDWFKRVPAVVFACLLPGELRIVLHPGAGMADGGIPHNVAAALVPLELWVPNTPLWVELDDDFNVVRVWHREE